MFLVIVYSCVFIGVEVFLVMIEVYISNGNLKMIIVGLFEIIVKEVVD